MGGLGIARIGRPWPPERVRADKASPPTRDRAQLRRRGIARPGRPGPAAAGRPRWPSPAFDPVNSRGPPRCGMRDQRMAPPTSKHARVGFRVRRAIAARALESASCAVWFARRPRAPRREQGRGGASSPVRWPRPQGECSRQRRPCVWRWCVVHSGDQPPGVGIQGASDWKDPRGGEERGAPRVRLAPRGRGRVTRGARPSAQSRLAASRAVTAVAHHGDQLLFQVTASSSRCTHPCRRAASCCPRDRDDGGAGHGDPDGGLVDSAEVEQTAGINLSAPETG
ncbi:UNVERIFIED_ORG: hypothetical protein CLV66_11286 [Actinomadura viridilutea]